MLKKYALPLLAPDGGGGGVATAPVLPASAPAASLVPAPSAAPPAGGGPAKPANPFSKVDAKAKPAPSPTPAVPAAGKPAAPADPAGAKPAAPPTDPAASAKPATPTPAAPSPGKETAPELRAQLKKLEADLAARTKSASDLEARIKDFEARGKDTEALTARLTEMEKSIADRDGEIRMLKQEASPEFKEKWDKPYFQAVAFVEHQIKQLEVTVSGQDGQQTVRPAEFKDFEYIYRLPVGKAAQVAKNLFGDQADIVMKHVNDLKYREFERNNALQEERANAKAKNDKEVADRSAAQAQLNRAWEAAKKDVSEAEEYTIDPTDKELIDLLREGLEIADAKPADMQEHIYKNAHVRMRIGMYPVLQMKIARLEAQLAKAKAEGGEDIPGKVKRSGGDAGGGEPQESWEQGALKAVNG